MQYQVPQFIDTEDKIVGPFTLRQFAYVGVAGLLSALAYFLFQTWLFVIIALVLVGGSLALSFVKINGRPLISMAIAALRFYWQPQTYVWKPNHPVAQQHHEPQAVPEIASIPTGKHPSESAAHAAFSHPITHSDARAAAHPATRPAVKTPQDLASGDALHKSWQDLQTGMRPAKLQSASQFVEKKMAERYQIFQRSLGDRQAARRVDYR